MTTTIGASGLLLPGGDYMSRPVYRVASYSTGYLGDGATGTRDYTIHSVASNGPDSTHAWVGTIGARTSYWVRYTDIPFNGLMYFAFNYQRSHVQASTGANITVKVQMLIAGGSTGSTWPYQWSIVVLGPSSVA